MTIQKILEKYEPKEENLLEAIREINRQFGNFDKKSVFRVADYFGISPARVFSVASFTDDVKKEKAPKLLIQICDGGNCQTKKANLVLDEMEKILKIKVGDDFSSQVMIERMSCIGKCLLGPIVIINDTVFERVTVEKVNGILSGYLEYKIK